MPNQTPPRSVRVPDERWGAFKAAAERRGANASEVLNRYMDTYIRNAERTTPQTRTFTVPADGIIKSFADLHALPIGTIVTDGEDNIYERNPEGLWANQFGFFPTATDLYRLMPLRVAGFTTDN